MGDKDDVYFTRLLALVPAEFAFSQEAKAVLPNQDEKIKAKKGSKQKRKKNGGKETPVSGVGVQELQGEENSETNSKKPGPGKKMRLDPTCNSTVSSPQSTPNGMDEKITAKKGSEQKRKKKGGKETPVSGVGVQEMQKKLRPRKAELQGQTKLQGRGVKKTLEGSKKRRKVKGGKKGK